MFRGYIGCVLELNVLGEIFGQVASVTMESTSCCLLLPVRLTKLDGFENTQ